MNDLNKDTFNDFIKSGDKLVLIDFWAPWCGPCKMLSPILEELATELSDKIEVAKVNVDENQELSAQYQISSIPCVHFYKNGQLINQSVGFLPKDALKSFIEKNL